jgi:hypothetical protein
VDSPEQPMKAFEEWLRVRGRRFIYPPTPTLSGRVAARLRGESLGQRRPRIALFSGSALVSGRRGILATALVLAILVLGLALAVSPTARTALAEFFRLQRIEVSPIESPSTTPPSPSALPGFENVAGGTTLAEARSKADFPVRLPTYPEGLGRPDAVYFQDLLHLGQQVILVYQAKPGLGLKPGDGKDILPSVALEAGFTLFQFKTQGIFQKQILPETLVEETEVGGAKALWFEGAAHYLQYRDAEGRVITEFQRLVEGNTLAWEMGEVTYRLEISLPKAEAIKIAESLR